MKPDKYDYEFRIRGRMASGWADWLDQAECRTDGPDSLLVLRDADRSALYGALRTLGDLDCRLISIRILES